MLKKYLNIIVLFISIMLFQNIQALSLKFDEKEKVLLITDIHFDPFTSCGLNANFESKNCIRNLLNTNIENWEFNNYEKNNYGEETNYAFLEKGLNNLKEIVKNNNVSSIFITGDLLSHFFVDNFKKYYKHGTHKEYTKLTTDTIEFVIYKIYKIAENAKIYYVLGNNDTNKGNFNFPSFEFRKILTNKIAKYMAYPNRFKEKFIKAGYFSMPLNNKVEVIGLNFNLLTIENEDSYIDKEEALKQLHFLKHTLHLLEKENKRAIILQHEPFGIDVYSVSKNYENKLLLIKDLQKKYIKVYKQYSNIINNYYFGHFHMENIQVLGDIFAFSTLGFSVDFDNNPGFKILKLNHSGKLINYKTYYANYGNKKLNFKVLYNLNKAYNIDMYNHSNFFKNELNVGNNKYWNKYKNYYSGNSYKNVNNEEIPILYDKYATIYYCGIKTFVVKNFEVCVFESKYNYY